MSSLPILIEFFNKGIKVRVEGADLALTAPQGSLTAALLSRVKNEKSALLLSLDQIREKAGEDWSEVANDPTQLKTFADMLAIDEMRHRGVVPDHYTATTKCRHCGPVPIWEGCPPEVLGCPWCFNRHAELPIPTGIAR